MLAAVARGHAAQAEWGKSSFAQRRKLLKIMLRARPAPSLSLSLSLASRGRSRRRGEPVAFGLNDLSQVGEKDAPIFFPRVSGKRISHGARRVTRRWVVENQSTIAGVAVRDSGKTLTDAVFGEILVTCEKLKWLIAEGERVLKPERRAPGTTVVFTKNVRVEWEPLGVIGAIVHSAPAAYVS